MSAPRTAPGPRSSPIVRQALGGQLSPTVAERAAVEAHLGLIDRVGIRGAMLGLDLVPGVVLVDVRDATTHRMPTGQAHVVVWGGKPVEVFRAVDLHRPRGVELTVQWEPATWWHHVIATLRIWAARKRRKSKAAKTDR